MKIITLNTSINKNKKLSSLDKLTGNYGIVVDFKKHKKNEMYDKVKQELEEIRDSMILEENITPIGQPLSSEEIEVLNDMGLLNDNNF